MAEPMDAVAAVKPRIHYGSIEETERARLAQEKEQGMSAIQLGIQRGNINVAPGGVAPMAVSEGMQTSMAAHKQILDEFDRKKRARDLHLPTDDVRVKQRLRQLGEPICLFGEIAFDRRERLRDLLSRMEEDARQKYIDTRKEETAELSEEEEEEEFFTEGTLELKRMRESLIAFSMPRAKARLEKQREELNKPLAIILQKRQETEKYIKHFTNYGSQFGDDRPLSYGVFSPDGGALVTSSWRGSIKMWSVPSLEPIRSWNGHNTRVGNVSFHPQARISQDPGAVNLVSCSAEGEISLWALDSNEPIGHLIGHKVRVAKVVFHPTGRFVGSASFDTSWRLWDVETRRELLLQEGHSKEVYGIAFHPDGSLAASCGIDAHVLVWDLRSGRRAIDFEGHVKPIYAVDFSSSGFEIATGGEDNAIRIWDLRMRKCRYMLPAHTNLISSLKFDPDRGSYLISGSYDESIHIYLAPDWKHVKTLVGHENKVMSVDIAPDGKYFASASYDRTVKLWESNPLAEI